MIRLMRRQEINHSGTIEQRILAMTPERMQARLRMPDAQIIEHDAEEEK
jgi:hypothetical protein